MTLVPKFPAFFNDCRADQKRKRVSVFYFASVYYLLFSYLK